MDSAQIEVLHQRASEHYIRGEFRDALEAWRELLVLDPSDEQALEGVRLSTVLSEGSDPEKEPIAFDLSPHPSDENVLATHERAQVDCQGAPSVSERVSAARMYWSAGRTKEAATACREALALDPGRIEAVGLLRQCEGAIATEAELDQGLAVLDRPASSNVQPSSVAGEAGSLQPWFGPEGNDAVMMDRAASSGTLDPVPRPVALSRPAPAAMKNPGSSAGPADGGASLKEARRGSDTPTVTCEPSEFEGPASGSVAAIPPSADARAAGSGSNAAALELQRRLQDLLTEAHEAAENGSVEEALSVLSRVFILDEENAQALALEERLRSEIGKRAQEIEENMVEGVHAYNQDRLEEARQQFLQVLARAPHHREAQDFLERIDARFAARDVATSARPEPHGPLNSIETPLGGEDLLGAMPLDGPGTAPRELLPEPESETLGVHRPFAPSERKPRYDRPRPATAAPVENVSPLLIAKRSRTLAIALGVASVVGLVAGSWFFLARSSSAPAASRIGGDSKRGPTTTPAAQAKGTPPPASLALSPEEIAARVAEKTAKARTAWENRDYAGAVLAYNEVLRLDPLSTEARSGLIRAGDKYKEQKAEQERLDSIRMAFKDGEYTSALRLLYRVPQNVDPHRLDRYKANGWYNLGVVALRAGECGGALSHLQEALTIRPNEETFQRTKVLALRYKDAPKDRAYYDDVERLALRGPEED